MTSQLFSWRSLPPRLGQHFAKSPSLWRPTRERRQERHSPRTRRALRQQRNICMSSSSNYPRHNDEEGDDCAYYQRHDDFAVSGVEAASSPPSWTFVDTTHNINNTHTTDNNYNQRLLSRDNSIHVTDEVFNSISHLSAAMLSLLGMVLLIAQSGGNAWKIVSFSVYGSSLLFLFCCSTLHHAISGTAEVCKQAKREREQCNMQ